ncbi:MULTISPECIES: oxygen-insensitive NAD(P)H nitroreductase [Flavobacteriaceae]|uniref:Oxygen-insensitive NAD(P)H nitroreductase n=1 Tax=Olleya sediminilitoris TaxID=2795739 RepID=A0ABS1WML6_9FLAO|nr:MULTISPECIES: oxygen-insensitive NAD(P)H nitroreductase [Flavobacteriaceae]MBL7560367.1 oxygen-insensitive NAD(P)H nitroreductase [Olleya sediminilitoris]SHM93800.1 nitroreductase / dihydropteridine reductase [Polaribacter sp. KT 15]
MNLTETLNWRYTTKEFDSTKKISEADMAEVKNLLRMSPSSVNLQPWHFIVAETTEGKARIAKGTQGFFHFNEPKVTNASAVVLFCSKIDADDAYYQHIADTEDKNGRFPNEDIKNGFLGAVKAFAGIHKYDLKDQQHWMEKQVYLNIGSFLLGVASLGIDATPMEGIDVKALDEEFGLREKGFTALVAVSIGYRADSDFNSTDKTPKSRLPESELFTEI